MAEKNLEEICKCLGTFVGGISLISIANIIGLTGYLTAIKGEYSLPNLFFASGTLIAAPLLFTTGIILETYSLYTLGKTIDPYIENSISYLNKNADAPDKIM